MNIYGHEMDLEEAEPGEVVVDVMVIARTLRYDDEGHGEDAVLISTTRQTTGMIQAGMLHFSLESTGYDGDES